MGADRESARARDARSGLDVIASRPTRYAVSVAASSVGDVVSSAGGLLFDLRSAGWDVTVLGSVSADVQPLTILGLDAVEVDSSVMHWAESVDTTGAVTAPTPLVTVDDVWARAVEAAHTGLTEVVLWGDPPSEAEGVQMTPVAYRPSQAARAFKECALRAAGLSAQAWDSIERYLQVGPLSETSLRAGVETRLLGRLESC